MSFSPTFPRSSRVVFWRTGRAGEVIGNTLDDVTCTVRYDGHTCGCTVPTSALMPEEKYVEIDNAIGGVSARLDVRCGCGFTSKFCRVAKREGRCSRALQV